MLLLAIKLLIYTLFGLIIAPFMYFFGPIEFGESFRRGLYNMINKSYVRGQINSSERNKLFDMLHD